MPLYGNKSIELLSINHILSSGYVKCCVLSLKLCYFNFFYSNETKLGLKLENFAISKYKGNCPIIQNIRHFSKMPLTCLGL